MLSRYFHTLRYLKPVQWYGRLWFRLYRPRVNSELSLACRRPDGTWTAAIQRPPCLSGPARFTFLNQTADVSTAADWNRFGMDRLWLYHLHYFDDLNAHAAAGRGDWHRALIERWIGENPAGRGVGWESYPLSRRSVNWIKWALHGNALTHGALRSLASQVDYLHRRIEWHLLGNHLLANATALVFAGCFFTGERADRWLRTGLKILARQLPEQVLDDGGHFERSPMYHAMVLEDLLDLINLARTYPDRVPAAQVEQWQDTAKRMQSWLRAMCHPDGEIGFFNDAAIGMASPPDAIWEYANRLGLKPGPAPVSGIRYLSASGYIRLAAGPAVALLDVAPIGPDYQPGHAHADTLAFELSLHDQRVLVNTGTGCYGIRPERHYQRGTSAHNTVVVDGQDSSEVWSAFRVARRALPLDLYIAEDPALTTIACSHDGYRRLPGRVTHRRSWRFSPGLLRVEDELAGRYNTAVAHYYLHPDVRVQIDKRGHAGRLVLPGGQVIDWWLEAGRVDLEPSLYYPRFGLSQPNQCLAVRLDQGWARIGFAWT